MRSPTSPPRTSPRPPRFRPRVEWLEDRWAPATLKPGFVETAVAGDLTNPTSIEVSPDGFLFVAEQDGTMEVWQGGSQVQADFFQDAPLNVPTISYQFGDERGLLGVAFDPLFENNRHVYVYYTYEDPGDFTFNNRVSRFTANETGDLALADSETVLLDLDDAESFYHNGGAIDFGKDGKLYIAVGEGWQNPGNAQSLTNPFGKILRINPDGTIPDDNPFLEQTEGIDEAIWARGLRNPYSFAFQPGTGKMFINDVGEDTWEEINVGKRGANYNWPRTEGDFTPPSPNPKKLTPPLYAYRHQGFNGIVGAAFYNPADPQFPRGYAGDYFFADLGQGWIKTLDLNSQKVTTFATDLSFPVDLEVAPDGSLLYLERGTGQVFEVRADPDLLPTITSHPGDVTQESGENASFVVTATSDEPLTYQWQRNDGGGFVNIPDATKATYTVKDVGPGDDGAQFRAIVRNKYGQVPSDPATLTVTGGGSAAGPVDDLLAEHPALLTSLAALRHG